MSERTRDLYAGGLTIFMGVGVALIGQTYKIGTLTQMGPGYFPTALGVLLAFLGVLIGLGAISGKSEAVAVAAADVHHGFAAKFDWRGWTCIVGSVLVFMLFAEYLGLLPATFCCIFLACWGDRKATFKGSFLLSASITFFGILLFSKVLHVQIPIVRGI